MVLSGSLQLKKITTSRDTFIKRKSILRSSVFNILFQLWLFFNGGGKVENRTIALLYKKKFLYGT